MCNIDRRAMLQRGVCKYCLNMFYYILSDAIETISSNLPSPHQQVQVPFTASAKNHYPHSSYDAGAEDEESTPIEVFPETIPTSIAVGSSLHPHHRMDFAAGGDFSRFSQQTTTTTTTTFNNTSNNNTTTNTRSTTDAMPITPVTTSTTAEKTATRNANEVEGEIIGQPEQWVVQPSAQGCLYKCRITRDRKGMDRGMFPLYYLHLERDYGKKIFLLAGNVQTFLRIFQTYFKIDTCMLVFNVSKQCSYRSINGRRVIK